MESHPALRAQGLVCEAVAIVTVHCVMADVTCDCSFKALSQRLVFGKHAIRGGFVPTGEKANAGAEKGEQAGGDHTGWQGVGGALTELHRQDCPGSGPEVRAGRRLVS